VFNASDKPALFSRPEQEILQDIIYKTSLESGSIVFFNETGSGAHLIKRSGPISVFFIAYRAMIVRL
jgi:hypothetical protein